MNNQVDFGSLFNAVFTHIVKLETDNHIKVEHFEFKDGVFSLKISDLALKYQGQEVGTGDLTIQERKRD